MNMSRKLVSAELKEWQEYKERDERIVMSVTEDFRRVGKVEKFS